MYSWWKSSRLSKREFIKQNKYEIVTAIENVIGGSKQAHYLKYEPLRKYGHLNEPARRYGHPLMINFYNEKGQHLLGSDGTIVILKSDGIKTVRGAMNRLREYKKLNRIPPWAKSYMILDYDTLDSSGLPATLGSGSIDSI